ncbi:MAG TPA: class I SAM-dependent methyltransferase [bacterium]|nr:class I SAM-dependent methyltransferase [bacterium]
MSEHPNTFFIPQKNDIPLCTEKIRQWYYNIIPEIEQAQYPLSKLSLLKDKRNYYGKYLSEDTREFFLNHFGRNLVGAVNFISDGRENLRYLEVGSGCGTQLLLMAFLGAEVFGCDMRKTVCELVENRKIFYEKLTNSNLNISLICEDFFKVNWDEFPKFNTLNFLFSFNNLLPSQNVLELVNQLIKPGGRLVIQDTNPCNYYNRFFRKQDAFPPWKIVEILNGYGFKIHSLKGGYALPPILWRFLPGSILSPIDQFLCRSLFMSPSYHLMAEKLLS